LENPTKFFTAWDNYSYDEAEAVVVARDSEAVAEVVADLVEEASEVVAAAVEE